MKKKKPIAQVSEIDPVPLYRSYGVKKKETFLTRFNNRLADVLRIGILIWLLILWGIGIASLILMLEEVGVVLSILTVILVVYFKLCRKLRKRVRFLSAKKRKCKKLGYRTFSCRSLLSGLRLQDDGVDAVVDTGKTLWLIRYLTPPKRLTKILMEYDGSITVRTNIASEIASRRRMLSFGAPVSRTYSYAPFDTSEAAVNALLKAHDPERKKKLRSVRILPDATNRRIACAVVINPSPYEINKKDRDGGVVPSGTGERMKDYVLFTGSGFLEMLERGLEE